VIRRVALLAVLSLAGSAALASAELVTLRSGGVLSVKSYHEDGESAILVLRSGGVVVCRADQVVSVGPDEVARPEAEPLAAQGPGPNVDAPYGSEIDRLARLHGVDARLIHAIVRVESGYRPDARSPKGAMGLMQLMPATASRLGVARPYDPVANLDGGIRYLKDLLGQFDLPLALAAYNAGESAVRRFQGIPPFAETRAYVRQVLALAGSAGD
jgi:soluble lytic murein transglycosylase-like protein